MANKKFTRKQIADCGHKKKLLVIIDNFVYDLTTFIDEHPGGRDVLVTVTGQDASEEFYDACHTLDAKELMVKYRVGELVVEDQVAVKKNINYELEKSTGTRKSDNSRHFFFTVIVLPMMLGIALPILYVYLFG